MGLTLTLGIHPFLVGGLIVLGIVASLMLILTILIQRPQGGGLAAAFGGAGAGSGQTAFGAKTGDALTIMTIVVFVLWLLISIGLVHVTKAASAPARPQQQETPAEEGAGDGMTPETSGDAVNPETPSTDAPASTDESPATDTSIPPAPGSDPTGTETPSSEPPKTEPSPEPSTTPAPGGGGP